MLVITLGSQASGSTWLFNVARELLRAAGRPCFSESADEAMEALDQMPVAVDDVVLKAYSLDQRLLRIAMLAQAKIIVSTRDPRDSAVSQQERFDVSMRTIAGEFSRSFATIEALPATLSILRFHYEDRFMDEAATVARVADFLGLPTGEEVASAIHEGLTANAVREAIRQRLLVMPSPAEWKHDPETHWHPNHLGDGVSGKWRERLDEAGRAVIDGCVAPIASRSLWSGQPVIWPAQMFENDGGHFERPEITLTFEHDPKLLAWGPYLHLPCGRWRAVPKLRTDRRFGLPRVEVEAYSPWFDRVYASAAGPVRREGTRDLVLDFEHRDHFQPLELRIRSLPNAPGSVTFAGWSLYWMSV